MAEVINQNVSLGKSRMLNIQNRAKSVQMTETKKAATSLIDVTA